MKGYKTKDPATSSAGLSWKRCSKCRKKFRHLVMYKGITYCRGCYRSKTHTIWAYKKNPRKVQTIFCLALTKEEAERVDRRLVELYGKINRNRSKYVRDLILKDIGVNKGIEIWGAK